ncbi:hypothetical protein [Streptomyces chartreusis]|uniref:Cell wall protein n=1 Tax=Streptomyces chartreusis TaxID=1969 RepID=A0A7H8T729_STRCX|nr:hypothetical protein [Streptomyces chartreusis]QKZ18822.1 hypothetical protein HUT05_16495 [Streptomyces chartreusis]
MDYDTGLVRYCLEGMVARLGISRATISRHVAYLREMGSLVWVQRGSRANVRRVRGMKGYAGTATVYGAVIPAVFDKAHDCIVVGSGYAARIVIDQRGTAPASAELVTAVDNSAVDKRGSGAVETPSRTRVEKVGQVKVVGGSNYISHQRASRSTARIPQRNTLIDGRRRTAGDVRRAGQTVRRVRALVTWTQTVSLRRLEFILRPLTDRGLDAHEIAAELMGMCAGVRWLPKRPDLFIAARIAADASHEQQLAEVRDVASENQHVAQGMKNAAWASFIARKQALEAEETAALVRTEADRALARADWNVWPQVADHFDEDPDDAIDLYGLRLCQYAVAQADRQRDAYF